MHAMNQPSGELFTSGQAARMTGVSHSTINRYSDSGVLKCEYHIHRGQRLFCLDSIKAFQLYLAGRK